MFPLIIRVIFIIFCSISNGFATLPVIDFGTITNLIKNYNQLKSQYILLQQTYQNAEQQLSQVRKLTHDAEGHYGFGQLLNDADALKQQTWSPSNWQNTLRGLSGGNAERYQELVNHYEYSYPVLSEQSFQKGATVAKTHTYERDRQVNRAAMVNATYAFNTINEHIKKIHYLSQHIDQTPNSKAATDLNSRLITEVAYIQTQELKMQILLNQQLAQTQVNQIVGHSDEAQFNTLPKE